jgi:hypothetical protein
VNPARCARIAVSTRERRENPNIWADGPEWIARACTIIVSRDCLDSVDGRRRDTCAAALVCTAGSLTSEERCMTMST